MTQDEWSKAVNGFLHAVLKNFDKEETQKDYTLNNFDAKGKRVRTAEDSTLDDNDYLKNTVEDYHRKYINALAEKGVLEQKVSRQRRELKRLNRRIRQMQVQIKLSMMHSQTRDERIRNLVRHSNETTARNDLAQQERDRLAQENSELREQLEEAVMARELLARQVDNLGSKAVAAQREPAPDHSWIEFETIGDIPKLKAFMSKLDNMIRKADKRL